MTENDPGPAMTVDQARSQFQSLWDARMPNEPLPQYWEHDLAPLLRQARFTFADFAVTMDIAAAATLDDSRKARTDPRWRYFLGVMRNKASLSQAAAPPPQAAAPDPTAPPLADAGVLNQLAAIADALERIAGVLEIMAAHDLNHG